MAADACRHTALRECERESATTFCRADPPPGQVGPSKCRDYHSALVVAVGELKLGIISPHWRTGGEAASRSQTTKPQWCVGTAVLRPTPGGTWRQGTAFSGRQRLCSSVSLGPSLSLSPPLWESFGVRGPPVYTPPPSSQHCARCVRFSKTSAASHSPPPACVCARAAVAGSCLSSLEREPRGRCPRTT